MSMKKKKFVVEVTNQSNKIIKSLNVEFMVVRVLYGPQPMVIKNMSYEQGIDEWEENYKACYKSVSKKTIKQYYQHEQYLPLYPGTSFSVELDFLVPPENIISVPNEISPLISYEYVLRFSYSKGKLMKKKVKYGVKFLVLEKPNVDREFSEDHSEDDKEKLFVFEPLQHLDENYEEEVVTVFNQDTPENQETEDEYQPIPDDEENMELLNFEEGEDQNDFGLALGMGEELNDDWL